MSEKALINSITEVPGIIEKHLSKEFIEKQVSPYNTNGLKPHEISTLESKLHEMYIYWHQLNQAITETHERKEERINIGAAHLAKLAFMLELSKDVKNIDFIKSRLKDKKKYYSALFELEVLCTYIENDVNIEVVEEGRDKTPDFIASYGEKKLCIEAKAFENDTSITNKKITKLSRDIENIAVGKKCCLDVYVELLSGIDDVNTASLLDNIKNFAHLANISTYNHVFFSTEHNYKLTLRCIEKWGKISYFNFDQVIPTPDFIDGNAQSISMTMMKTETHVEVSNPRFVNIKPFQKIDFKTAIKTNLKKASTQNIGDYPLIVHVGIPHYSSSEILKSSELAMHHIYRHLKGSTKTICAVILHSTTIDIKSDESSHLSNNITAIPNPNSFKSIPTGHKFYSEVQLLPPNFDDFKISIKIDVGSIILKTRKNIFIRLLHLSNENATKQIMISNSENYHGSLLIQKFDIDSGVQSHYIKLTEFKTGSNLHIVWKGLNLSVSNDSGKIQVCHALL